MAPGGNLRTRTRDDGTVMVETAPHWWVSAAWLKQHGGTAQPNTNVKTSPQPALPTGSAGRVSGTLEARKGQVGRAGRAGEVGASDGRQPLPLPISGDPSRTSVRSVDPSRTTLATDQKARARDGSKLKRGRQPRGEPNPIREAVLDRFAATDDSHGDIAAATGAARGSIGVWISEARPAGDARVKAGDKRRGRK